LVCYTPHEGKGLSAAASTRKKQHRDSSGSMGDAEKGKREEESSRVERCTMVRKEFQGFSLEQYQGRGSFCNSI